jgi:Fe-S oxidoreductase
LEPALRKQQQQTDGSKIATLDLPELYNCVHCGLCLNQCPTYRALRLEPESPRGRIHLVKAAAEGRIELNERFKDHIYLCLLCRACETACPSGVQYGRIAETAREHLGPPGSKVARAVQRIVFTRLLPVSAPAQIFRRPVALVSTERTAKVATAAAAERACRNGRLVAVHAEAIF